MQTNHSMKKSNLLSILLLLVISNINAQTGQSQFKRVVLNSIPKPMAPAHLVVTDQTFFDAVGSENKALDANETVLLSFNIQNDGMGDAYAVKLKIEDSANVKGINFNKEIKIGTLAAGTKTNVVISIIGTTDLVSAQASFVIDITEGNNFNADPLSFSFATNELKKSKLVIQEVAFSNKEQDGAPLMIGKVLQMTVLLQNTGQGDAKNVTIQFAPPFNVYASGASQDRITINELKSNESRTLKYEFFANKQYDTNFIPINIKVNENYNNLVLDESKSAPIEQGANTLKRLSVQDIKTAPTTISSVSLVPDVDKDIPVVAAKNYKRYALIFGNEDYSTYQTTLSQEENVDFAKNDARIFKEYCDKTFGIPTENIYLYTNATYGVMRQGIDKINKLIKSSEGDLEIFFYYAGHGLPDENTKEAYLIPIDISGANVQSGIKLQDIYNSFSEGESGGVTMFIDACFSGGARNQQLVKARGVKIVPRSDYLPGNVVSFSASSGTQSSNAYMDKKHGMFTYYLLKNIQESKGEITYKSLYDNLKQKVKLESVRVNSKEQDPQINIGEKAKAIWENKSFIKK